MILAITSSEFQTAALGWLAAIGTIAAVAVPLYFKIRAQIAENQTRIDKHDAIQSVDTKSPLPPTSPPPNTP